MDKMEKTPEGVQSTTRPAAAVGRRELFGWTRWRRHRKASSLLLVQQLLLVVENCLDGQDGEDTGRRPVYYSSSSCCWL